MTDEEKKQSALIGDGYTTDEDTDLADDELDLDFLDEEEE